MKEEESEDYQVTSCVQNGSSKMMANPILKKRMKPL